MEIDIANKYKETTYKTIPSRFQLLSILVVSLTLIVVATVVYGEVWNLLLVLIVLHVLTGDD